MLKFIFGLALLVFNLIFPWQNASAEPQDSGSVVISQVMTGATASASHELIEIYNNSNQDVDITDWCLRYASASSSALGNKLICFSVADSKIQLFLPAKSYALALSSQLISSISPAPGHDWSFTGGMAGTGGHLRLTDASDNEIDKLGWGAAVNPENLPTVAHANGYLIQRKSIQADFLQDSDNNLEDFEIAEPRAVYSYGNIYEYEALDVCPNIDGMQTEVPADMTQDSLGNCLPDIVTVLPIEITEILPNPSGVDTGREFIELYNPNDSPVDLTYYILYLNDDMSKFYSFPVGLMIQPGEYLAVYNDSVKFSLLNSKGSVLLRSLDNIFVSTTGEYESPKDDTSWALIDNIWQYTNHPTPGQPNLPTDDSLNLKPCSEGQYRSLETNRCRNIATLTSSLTPCRPDQERNPETNRCRKISDSETSLTPCKEGQYRNPETNRCKSIASASSTLVPCKENQERNPETNRCRNIVQMSEADYAVEGVKKEAGWPVVWLIGGLVLALALGYAVWEWRRDLAKLWSNLTTFFRRNSSR